MMSVNGKPFGDPKIGAINLSEIYQRYMSQENRVASFQTKQEADEAARGAGWTATEGNHRCPDCTAETNAHSPYAGMVERNGAYIPWPPR